MRLFVDYKYNQTGKGKFLLLLTRELAKQGVEIVASHRKADVALAVTTMNGKYCCPVVLRVDGIRLKKRKSDIWYNKQVKNAIKKADAVIFQSEFARKYIRKKLKVTPRREAVVYNGAKASDFAVAPMESDGVKIVLLCGHWGGGRPRKHKNLAAMLDIAAAHTAMRGDVLYVVAGDTTPKANNERILYIGHLTGEALHRWYATASVMLNLATLDWCPNATIEAIVARVPVVCYAGTGVGEIVEGYGTVLNKDATQQDIIAELDKYLDSYIRLGGTELYAIESIAGQYREVFDAVRR